jgi:DNA (cytosine-5)-methyltransferase 1
MTALYNEIEPFAAQWLRSLISAGHIAPGAVDERSISDLTPADVAGPGQRHFFAGIGGWSYALRLAGVPDDASVWTGSCPCQPFSAAGKRSGTSDPRHLWPAWFALIRECRPAIIFGEQVASKDGLAWLDLVFADLERCGYSVGAADLCAAGVGAPHIRQRLFFVAYADELTRGQGSALARWSDPRVAAARRCNERPGSGGSAGQLGNPDIHKTEHYRNAGKSARSRLRNVARGAVKAGGLGNAGSNGNLQHDGELRGDEAQCQVRAADGNHAPIIAGATRGFWSNADWLPCIDGVSRPVEPIAQQMVDGSTESLGRIGTQLAKSVEEEVIHAAGTENRAREAMLNLRRSLEAEAIRRAPGRLHSVSEAPVLLAFVRELEEQGWTFSQGSSCSGAKVPQGSVRVLRHGETAASPPCGRGLDEQSAGESPDIMRVLSSVLARNTQAAWGETFDARARATHPLMVGAPARVGRLRGYGNAIVAEVAATFIEAALEAGDIQ